MPLPLVLAGPIVRRIQARPASVWVAPRHVGVMLSSRAETFHILGTYQVVSGYFSRATIMQFGRLLHVFGQTEKG